MKVLNEMRIQITLKKTLHAIDCQNRSINAKIAEVQAKDVVFHTIGNIELVDWTTINQMGLTKRTLCEIKLFKLNTFFSHFFAGP
jgi:hypothetical protein